MKKQDRLPSLTFKSLYSDETIAPGGGGGRPPPGGGGGVRGGGGGGGGGGGPAARPPARRGEAGAALPRSTRGAYTLSKRGRKLYSRLGTKLKRTLKQSNTQS